MHVDEVRTYMSRGNWATKSGGVLSVMLVAPYPFPKKFFKYNNEELKKTGDIRGMRVYTVRDIPEGMIGGKEFHRVRQEIVFATKGRIKWMCKDMFGNKREFVLTPNGVCVYVPPFILHTYEALEESDLVVIANTLFDPNNKKTQDTYPPEFL